MLAQTAAIDVAHAAKQTIISYSPIGAVKNTPAENIFSLSGSDKKFILLDSGGEGENKYFVLAYDSYAAAQFDPNGYQKFDPEDENNVANLMNKALMGEESVKGYEKLPQQITESVNRDSKWSIDAGYNISDGEVSCPLGLLSEDEYLKYMGKFGIEDEIREQSGRPGWWLRTARGYDANKDHVIMVPAGNAYLGSTVSWESWGVLGVRPCFYLNEDFFGINKFETKYLGKNVKAEILKSCSEEDLKELGYPEKEIEEIKDGSDFEEKISVNLPEGGTPWYVEKELDIEAEINLVSKKDKNYKVSFYLDGTKKYEQNVFVKGNSTKKMTFNTGFLNNNKHTVTLSVHDGDEEIKRISKTFHVLTGYKETFMEEYSKHGFNHHLRLAQYVSGMSNELEALRKMGVLVLRDGVEWGSGIEPNFKKRYNFSGFEPWVTEFSKNKNTSQVFTFAFNNDLYSGIDGSKVGSSTKYTPTTKNEYDNYADMVNVVLDKYPQIDYAQIWNEPLGSGFWKPGWDVPSYANLLGVSGAYVRKEHPETQIVAGSTGKTHVEFLEDIVSTGAYPYFDLFSIHPYVYPNKAEALGGELVMDNYLKRNMGGWKKMCSTEWGWPTHTGNKGSSFEHSATQIVLQYILFDEKRYELATAYQFNNFGTSKGDREQNFGIIENNRTPKTAAYTVSKFINDMSGAIHVGKLNNDDINIHFYYKNGEPIAIAWAKEGTKTLDFGGTSFSARDMYDTPIKVENGKISVNETPTYITGLPKSVMAKAILDSIKSEAELFLDSYAILMGKEPEYGTNSRFADTEAFEQYLNKAEEGAEGYELVKEKFVPELEKIEKLVLGGMPKEEDAKAALNEFYDLGNEFIKDYTDGRIKMSQRSFSGFLFSLNWMGESLANLYMASVEGNLGSPNLESRSKLSAFEAKMQAKEKTVVGGKYEFSESMLKFIRKYSDMAYDVAAKKENNPSKAGVVKSRELLSERLTEWLEGMNRTEKMSHTAMLLQMTRKNRVFYNFAENKAVFSLYNFGTKDFSGSIRLLDSEGNLVVETKAELKAGENGEFTKQFTLRNNTEEPEKYTMQLVSGNEVLLEQPVDDVTLKGKSNIRMNPTDKTISELEEVSFEIDNTFNKEMTVSIEAEAPEGWEFENNKTEVTIKPGETGTAAFKVKKIKKTDFNEYYFSAKAFENEEQVASVSNAPLNFTVVTPMSSSVDVAGFNGDVSDWKSAYPVMVAAPAAPQKAESWENSTMSMRAYARWDSDYLYVLARVNDQIHLNRQTGNSIWNGDAIQISIDGANDKTAAYKEGDYEYGFALTDHGQESEAWYGGNEAFENMEFKIVRNEDEKMTYYLMKFPKAAVSPLELKKGSVFGMNLVIADCDYISRDRFEELTYGTAYTKSPSYYYDWYLKGNE